MPHSTKATLLYMGRARRGLPCAVCSDDKIGWISRGSRNDEFKDAATYRQNLVQLIAQWMATEGREVLPTVRELSSINRGTIFSGEVCVE